MRISVSTGEMVIVFLLLAAAMALVVFSYRRTLPPTGTRFRILLFSVRALAVLLLVLALLDPVFTFARMRDEDRYLAVLLDTSLSMTLPDSPGDPAHATRTRWDVARDLLWGSKEDHGKPLLAEMNRRVPVRLFASDAGAREVPGALSGVDSLVPSGGASEIARAIRDAGRIAGSGLAGIVVVSDGRNTAPDDAAAAARDALVPVHTVLIGEEGVPPDLAVVAARAPDVAYAGSRLNVEFEVSARGFGGRRVPVVLREDGRTLDSVLVSPPAEGSARGVVGVTPSTPGAHRYTLSVPAAPGEIVAANNDAHLLVTVEKEKLHVLYVESVPRWDYTFLARALAADQGIALTRRVTGKNATSFLPTDRELAATDVLILGNMPLQALDPAAVTRLRNFLSASGRGLLVLGGEEGLRSFRDAGAPLLPLRSSGGPAEPGAWRVELTARGEDHAVTRLAADGATNRVMWESLPPLLSRNAGVTPVAGAEVLLESRVSAGAATPILAVMRAGSGKVAEFAGSGLWRWSFLMAGTGRGSEAFDRLASNLVRWLAAREEAGRVRATPDRSLYRYGEPVGFTARVFDENLTPRAGATVRATLVRRSGTGTGAADTTAIVLEEVRGNAGVYRGRFGPLAPARYDYRVAARGDGRLIGEARGETEVVSASVEFEALDTDPELMKRIAAETGGGSYRAADTRGLLDALDVAPAKRREETEVRPGRSPYLFIAVVLLLGAEWTFRRRRGLW